MMKSLICILLVLMPASVAIASKPLSYVGKSGPGIGKHIVFMAGDNAYRSEESLPALARIMAKHHGFKCTVLFTIDQPTGEIVAGNSNMPGMEALMGEMPGHALAAPAPGRRPNIAVWLAS